MLNAGDKCTACKQGLLERTTTGIACSQCDFVLDEPELVQQLARQRVEAGEFTFKAKTLRIPIETPEDGENFLRGLVLAQTNNSSPLFPELIESVNKILEPYRKHLLEQQLAARV